MKRKRKLRLNVLVTGASGFIGSRVVSKLLSSSTFPSHLSSNSYEILCLTRNIDSLRGRYEQYKDAFKTIGSRCK